MTEYESPDGPIPDDVIETFDPADEWDHRRLDPQSVRTIQSHSITYWIGQVDGTEQFVSDRGHASKADRFDHCSQLGEGALPPCEYGPYSYREDAEAVHHDHYAEHVTVVCVVTGPDERIVLESRSGVVWWRRYAPTVVNPRHVSDTAVELAVSLADADSGIETPDDYGRAVSGWHDSQTPSEQSDVMNALATGDVPPEWGDDVFPYAVKFGDTNNVCSQPASVYATREAREQFEKAFAGKQSTPTIGGGFS